MKAHLTNTAIPSNKDQGNADTSTLKSQIYVDLQLSITILKKEDIQLV